MAREMQDAAPPRYQIAAPIGSGGFGAVYEALDTLTGHSVAVKRLDDQSGGAIVRFKQEFRVLADCHHPNLVGLKELFEQDGRWFIVMELVPGSDFLEYVRPEADRSPGFDEGRLRSALTGMAEGLRALHGYGVLHRDLKPSNVRVRPDGRAVLLDFGVATSIDTVEHSANVVIGTVRYMAPEQAASETLGPAADVYALGVCLFEALTGRVPFDGERAMNILLDKQRRPAPLASTLNPETPPDLNALCARMLATDPRQRPGLDEILRTLGGDSELPSDPLWAASRSSPEEFAGRDAELAVLERALDAAQREGLGIVLVEGTSGVGKSQLVAEFVRRASRRQPELLALRGRCYENEQVSYKAFDGCIDELARWLARLTDQASAALLPVRAALLAQLFPVLRQVKPIARAPREGASADPTARRLEAFTALAGLLGRLAQQRPLVLVVDDLQWADTESFRLLQSLLEHAAPPRLLLVASLRPREELEGDALAHVETLRKLPQTTVIALRGLPRPEARALAARLLGPGAPEALLEVLADESQGHPLLLGELVRYTRAHQDGARGKLTLDAALRARIEQLEPPPRALLELVALAARPHGAHVFARALGVPDVDEPARVLLAARLVRLRKGQELGCYHDRIGRTVHELLTPAHSRELHGRLASALEAARDTDPVEQARHWDLAGDRQRAVVAYELAVVRALDTLAFARAGQLCARALELLGESGSERAQQLLSQRAHALACAGRSGEAAALYQQAAERAQGEARIRLRSRWAQQLMLSGNVGQGFAAARALLIELGVSVPLGHAALLLRFLWDRLCLALRWRSARVAEPAAARRQLASEVIDELFHGVLLAQPLTMLTLTSQHLRLASGARSPERSAIDATTNGWILTVGGSLKKALPLFESSRARLKDSQRPHDIGLQAYLEGSARMAGFDWKGGSACLLRAQDVVREHCPDWPWLITNIRYHLGLAWYHLGEHRRIAQESERWLAEARERDNALEIALLTGMGHGFVRHLMADDPELALRERAQAMAAISPEPFSFIHLGHFMSKCITLSYQGGARTIRYLESFVAEHAHIPFFKLRVTQDVLIAFEAIAQLQACVEAPAERAERLQAVRALTRTMEKRSPLLRAYARMARAEIELLEGRRTRALEHARAARAEFEGLGSGARRNAQFLEGVIEGGAAGAAKQREVLEALAQQGWRDPLRAVRLGTISAWQLPEHAMASVRPVYWRASHAPPAAAVRSAPSSPVPERVSGVRGLAKPSASWPSNASALRSGARAFGSLSDRPARSAPPRHAPRGRFVGRERELSELFGAFERTCDDGCTLVLLAGESGIGKSALAHEFARRAEGSWPSVLVLHGACYEHLPDPYGAFEGAATGIASMLAALPNPQCEALLPEQAALLPQLFPVFASVPAIAEASDQGLPGELGLRRRAARACFVALLEKLCAQRELLFVIDDLHWADAESLRLLAALAEQRARVPAFVLCTAELSGSSLDPLRSVPATETMQLAGLPADATAALIDALCGTAPAPERQASWWRQSGGHPLFARELASADCSEEGTSLEDLLRARIDALPEPERELLALVALAERAHPTHVYAEARAGGALPPELLEALRERGLVSGGDQGVLRCEHERIAKAALAALAPARRRQLAAQLAVALASTTGDAAERARLWDEAEQSGQALDAHEQAGDEALLRLAPASAARHYERALTWLEQRPTEAHEERRSRLLERRAHALAADGQSTEAARAYRLAAEATAGAARLLMRAQSVEQALIGGQLEELQETAAETLRELGISVPKSDSVARARTVWERGRLATHRDELGAATNASPVIAPGLDALQRIAPLVGAVREPLAAALRARYVRSALRAGDPSHAARGRSPGKACSAPRNAKIRTLCSSVRVRSRRPRKHLSCSPSSRSRAARRRSRAGPCRRRSRP